MNTFLNKLFGRKSKAATLATGKFYFEIHHDHNDLIRAQNLVGEMFAQLKEYIVKSGGTITEATQASQLLNIHLEFTFEVKDLKMFRQEIFNQILFLAAIDFATKPNLNS